MRYFFHIQDRSGVIHDTEGSELPDLAAAWGEAWMSARDFAMEDIRHGGLVIRQIVIEDEQGHVLGAMPVSDIVH